MTWNGASRYVTE